MAAPCQVPDCERPRDAKGYCPPHYRAWRRNELTQDPLIPDAPDTEWVHRAACREVDPEIFFPVGTTGPALAQVAEAKAVCGRCPAAVQLKCLDYALTTRRQHGVWGGMTEDERRALPGWFRPTRQQVPA